MVMAVSEAIHLDIWQARVPSVVYLNGALLFVAGLAIVRAHNTWRFRWWIAVTLTGWLGMFLGLFRMFFPTAQPPAESFPTYAGIVTAFLLGALLIWKSYFEKPSTS